MSQITYSATEKRFNLTYQYKTKKGLIRSAAAKPKTFSGLANQVKRASDRGVKFAFINPNPNPVLSIEGTHQEAFIYRFENGNPITVFSGTLVDVLRRADMIRVNGTDEHKSALKTMTVNIQIAP
jgi:hypothetical protein